MNKRQLNKTPMIRETIIDGQHCLFCTYYKGCKTDYGVAFVVAPTKKLARAWAMNRPIGRLLDNRSTGKSGLKPLLWAQQQIVSLLPFLKRGERVIVEGSNDARFRAYARLQKFGFEQYDCSYPNGKETKVWLYEA